MSIRYFLKQFLFPPTGLILLILCAWWLRNRRPRLARGLFVLAVTLLCLLSMPVSVQHAARWLEAEEALPAAQVEHLAEQAQVIVVLGAGRSIADGAWLSDQPSSMAIERLRYAVRLAKSSGLPLLVSGGNPYSSPPSEAQMMAEVALRDFSYPVRWQEPKSRTTWENAVLSAQLLKTHGISRVVLVTQAWHMPRAVWSFEQQGLRVIPAPVGFVTSGSDQPSGGWLPDAQALWQSSVLINEALGLVAYKLAYHSADSAGQ